MSLALSFDRLMDLLGQHPAQWSAVILTGACALILISHYFARTLNAGRFGWQRRLRTWLGVDTGKRIGELSWLLIALHLLLWPVVAYAVLRIWGLHDEGHTLSAAIFREGFRVGAVTVVPAKVLLGVLSFVVLFTFTRWLKKKIEFDWLPRTGIEYSTREAVATLFGYATFVIAAIVGLSSAGVDFTKLAIVAGALSVGIGFGLQNIVSNFVSGLILLFERPVRAGDHIEVTGAQGVVRKIRIRATEIETGDRETIIVPNSSLLSNPVRNRNLRVRAGRVTLSVGVAYGSDPERVRQVLLQVAAAHRGVLGEPPASVQFINFGASSLDFELQVPILDADARGGIASDLRFAIVKAFRAEGIEMPYPQQDVYIRSLPEGWPPAAAGTAPPQPT